MNDILTLERLTNAMWRAEHALAYDGWLLQTAGGYTRRPNSISVLERSTLPFADKIAFCAAHYATRGLPPIYKIIPALGHNDAEMALEQAGYPRAGMNLVQTARLTGRFPDDPRAQTHNHLTEAWMQAFVRMKQLEPPDALAHAHMLERITDATLYAQAAVDGAIVAVGLGVVRAEWCGVFDVVTDEDWRGQGLASAMLHALLNGALELDATQALLQVNASNAPALRLYDRLGFTDAYTYTYRLRG